MQQSWADVGSDSDDDDDQAPVNQAPPPKVETEAEPEYYDEEPEPELALKEYNWPTEPPFTAYVGNLSYEIKTSEQMSQGLQDILHDRLQASVNIVTARLAIDHQENRSLGYGYVELETVEDVSWLASRVTPTDTMMRNSHRFIPRIMISVENALEIEQVDVEGTSSQVGCCRITATK